MIKSVIIDDEQHCIDRLKRLLIANHSATVEIIGCSQTVEEGIKQVATLRPDLILLDVQLNEKTGFDLLRALPRLNFEVIFTTAYEKFAIHAIKFSAIDYLLKPVDKDDLDLALTRLSYEISKKMTGVKLDHLLQTIERKNGSPRKILVPTVSGFEFLDVADIIRCQSDINYTTIFLKEKKKLLVAKTLKEFEEMLTVYDFFRVHNSHLINLACIKSYNKGKGGSLLLTDGSEIEVSTRRKDDFLKKMSQL
jgi:two-component system LytT family response regulator